MSEEIAAADSLLAQNAELRIKNEQLWKACVEQENEIARQTQTNEELRQVIEQMRKALEAERRHSAMVVADNAAWVLAARKYILATYLEQRLLAWGVLSDMAATDHPGAALLAELDATRAVAECWVRQPRYYDDCDPGQNDPYYAWYAEMDGLSAAYNAAVKVSEA